MSTVAEQGYQQGFVQGFRQGLEIAKRETVLDSITNGLELKFGAEGTRMLPAIYGIADVAVLCALWKAIRTATSLDQIRMVHGKLCS